jgi:hypothetical protein
MIFAINSIKSGKKKQMNKLKVLAVFGIVALFTCCALGKSSERRIVLAENKTAKCVIVLSDGAIEPEQTAARELADYLKKVTGAEFTIVKEEEETKKGTRIYVGPTKYAKDHDINCEKLGPEAWVMRTIDGNLILAGGKPRGTIYAVYHFLEDIIGVHWWSPWEEYVPSQLNLSIAALNRHGEPVFKNRCLRTTIGLKEVSPFNARNRINRLISNKPIPFKYGGDVRFGPPSLAHTEGHFIWWYKKEFDFKRNPEWFALKDGKRQIFKTFTKNQLCLSNPELRKAFLKKLKENIRETRNQPCPPMIFDVSLNDRPALCECEACKAIVRKYGNRDSGLLLEFVNYMADGIKDEYPGVMIETLAYQRTQNVPKGIVPRDNVIITLCDMTGIYTKPIPSDGSFAQNLADWSKIAKNLYVWDYHTNFSDSALPMPFESTFQNDLQLFRKYGVTGVMDEYHSPIFEELRDLRLWLLAKLFEDPYQNQTALIKTFTDLFYGPAGPYIREDISELGNAAKATPGHVWAFSKTGECKYLTLSFILKAQKIFDEAEKAVGDSGILHRRVRHARMALDKATLALLPKIWAKWDAEGKKRDDLPLNREKIAARLRDTVEEQWKFRINPSLSESMKKNISVEKAKFLTKIDKYLKMSPVAINPPAKFARLPRENYTAYAADSYMTCGNSAVEVIEDKYTQNGITCCVRLSDKSLASLDGNALKWDMHDHTKRATGKEATIRYIKLDEIIPGSGYHWYKLGTYCINKNNFLWIYGADLSIEVSDARDIFDPSCQYDIWARVKFEGPAFPYGGKKGKNAILIEWIVAVKKGK